MGEYLRKTNSLFLVKQTISFLNHISTSFVGTACFRIRKLCIITLIVFFCLLEEKYLSHSNASNTEMPHLLTPAFHPINFLTPIFTYSTSSGN